MIVGSSLPQSPLNGNSKGNSMGLTLPIDKIPNGDGDDNSLLARRGAEIPLNDSKPTGCQFRIDSPSMGPRRMSNLSLASFSTASESGISFGRNESLSLDSFNSDRSDFRNANGHSSLSPLEDRKSARLEASTVVRTLDFGDGPAKTNVSEISFFGAGESDGSEDSGESTDGDEEERSEIAPIVEGKPRLPAQCFYDRYELSEFGSWSGDCTRRASHSNSTKFTNSLDSVYTNTTNNSSSDSRPEAAPFSSDSTIFSWIAPRKRNYTVSFSAEEPEILEYEQVVFTPASTLALEYSQSESSSETSDCEPDDDASYRFGFRLQLNGE